MEEMKKKALVIEENLVMRKHIAGSLEHAFKCVECVNPEQAFHALNHHEFDLVVTDIEFNRTVREDHLRTVQALQHHAKIIILTQPRDVTVIYTAMRNNVNAVLLKPLDTGTLLQKVNQVLNPASGEGRQPDLAIRVRRQGGYVVLSLVGRLVSNTCTGLKLRMEQLIRRGIRKIALNFERLTSVDCRGFNLLVQCFKRVKEMAGDLCVFNVASLMSGVAVNLQSAYAVPVYLSESAFRREALKEGVESEYVLPLIRI